jgi:hypothetical protein
VCVCVCVSVLCFLAFMSSDEDDEVEVFRPRGTRAALAAASPSRANAAARAEEHSLSLSLSLEGEDDEKEETSKKKDHVESNSSCLICKTPFLSLSSDDRQRHVNDCIDKQLANESGPTTCFLCQKDVSHLSLERRATHISSCCDRFERENQPTFEGALAAGANSVVGATYFCLVCQKNLSKASQAARLQHVKSCAKKKQVDPVKYRRLGEGVLKAAAKAKEVVAANAPAAAPAPAGAASSSSASEKRMIVDPATGFERSSAPEKRRKSSKSTSRRARVALRDNEFRFDEEDEMMRLGVAISESLAMQPSSQPNDIIVMPSVQEELPNLTTAVRTNAAGFPEDDPTYSQIARELVKTPVKNKEVPVDHQPVATAVTTAGAAPPPPPASLENSSSARTSKLRARTDAKKGLWQMASARPNSEAGLYVETADLSVKKAADDVLVQPTTASFVPPGSEGAAVVFATPAAPSVHVIRVHAANEQDLQHLLANANNAYERGTANAFEMLQSRIKAATDEYYMTVGRLAVERDEAVRALKTRYHDKLISEHVQMPITSFSANSVPSVGITSPPKAGLVRVDVIAPQDAPKVDVVVLPPTDDLDDDHALAMLADEVEAAAVANRAAAAGVAVAACKVVLEARIAAALPPKEKEEAPLSPIKGSLLVVLDDSEVALNKSDLQDAGLIDLTPRAPTRSTGEMVDADLFGEGISPPSPLHHPGLSSAQHQMQSFYSPGVVEEERRIVVLADVMPEAPEEMPNFDAMTVDELKAHMEQNALCAAPEKVMRKTLKEIWKAKHSEYTASLNRAARMQARQVPPDDSITPVRPQKKAAVAVVATDRPVAVNAPPSSAAPVASKVAPVSNFAGPLPAASKGPASSTVAAPSIQVQVEPHPFSQDVAPASSQSEFVPDTEPATELAVLNFIRSSSFGPRVLVYDALPLHCLQDDLLRNGIKIGRKQLAKLLDKKGITYHDPDSKWK